ncbi:MAG: ABC transporter permease [Candidatus Hydrothermarchaeaceae archaeon]
MVVLLDSLVKAVGLVLSFDPELVSITLLSLYVSLIGVFFAAVLAMPLGITLGLNDFRGKKLVVNTINTFMGLPPVIVGLFLFVIFSRQGLLGATAMLFTPQIMALAQFIITFPIITGVTLSAIEGMEKDVRDLITSLGTTRFQMIYLSLFEIRYGLLTALMAGLGRAFSEVGAVIIVGGNIRHHTRVLTTSIVLETSRGEFETAMALGIILLGLAFSINYALTIVQERGRR